MIKYIRKQRNPASCIQLYLAYKLHRREILSGFFWSSSCVTVSLSPRVRLCDKVNSVHRCGWPPGLRLSLGLRRVQEDGAVRGEDLPGVRGGQLTFGPHQAHAVALLQGQDEAEGHGAPTGAGASAAAAAAVAPLWPRGGLQPLHAAVGHGQNGLHSVALPSRQQA